MNNCSERSVVAGGGDLYTARPPNQWRRFPAITTSPSPRATGRDSPVIIDHPSAPPSTMTPSAGALPPGRTITMSSTRTLGYNGADLHYRQRVQPRLEEARQASQALRSFARGTAFSIQCPSNIMTTSSASSHQNSSSWWISPSVAAHDAKNATVIPSAIKASFQVREF